MGARVFTLAGWVAILAAAAHVLGAVALAVSAGLALTGHATYPQGVSVGPLRLGGSITMPVSLGTDVCRAFDASEAAPADCTRFVIHRGEDDASTSGPERRNDADIRPLSATLEGELELATTGGWSPYVAARMAAAVAFSLLVAAVLYQLAVLLLETGRGRAFTLGSVRRLRVVGAALVAASLLDPLLNVLTRFDALGYWTESFGPGPSLQEATSIDVEAGTLVAGVLVLLLAAVFRRGADLQAEQELTV